MTSPTTTSTIFVGSSIDLEGLDTNAIANPLLADGDVSFYGHMSGVVLSNQDGTESALLSTWAGTGSGLVELSQDEPMAVISVTIANTGTSSISLPIGTIVSSASGVQYQIVQKPRQEAGWSDSSTGVGTAGLYTIAAGQSLTLMATALVDGPSGNIAATQVSQIGVAGASITGSTLITATDQWSSGTISLTNTTGRSLIVYEGMTVTGTGGTYEVGIDSTVAGFVSTDADLTSGYYVVAAGVTITVPIASINPITATTPSGVVNQELASNAVANSISGTGNLPSGLTIAASSALVTTGVVNPADQQHLSVLGAKSGFLSDATSAYFTTSQGYVPTEANVNSYNDYIWTQQDLVSWEAYVDNARAFGYLNLAPMMSEFETVDFATAPATQYARAAALYSGGIAFDMPSWFFLAREPAYQQSIEAEIKWATANGLRSSITLSPESGDDETFLADTQKVVAMLQAAGALPTQFVVKDGGVTGSSVLYSTDPNSLNNVANYLSSLVLTPSNSESGLEQRGTTARPDDLMTGVAPSATMTGAAPLHPFSIAQIFAETRTTTGTLTVTLSNAALGKLAAGSGLGVVSQNGAVFSISGTMAQLTAGLEALSFTAAALALGSGTLSVAVVDSAGTIVGTTAITVDNALVMTGIPTSLTATGFVFTDQSVQLADATASSVLTATVSLSDTSLGSFWNIVGGTLSADGSTLTVTGTASTLQSYLRNLQFVPSPGASGTEIQTVSVSDGTQTITAATTIALSPTTGLAVAYVPVNTAVTPGFSNTPYQDILIAKTSSPGGVLTVAVTLPSGIASFATPAVGTVSANGLVFTYSGTPAQIQAALRNLHVSLPYGSSKTSETMTLNLNGHLTTTVLSIGSADTVFVGAPDVTQGQYGATSIAAPLLVTGKVGLFDDYNAATATVVAGTATTLVQTWSGAAAGVYNSGETSGLALQTVTLANNTGSAITIPVGTLVATAAGVQFQIVQYNTGNANWVAGATGDGTIGSYVIAAGSSLALTAEAVVAGYTGNVAANAITSIAGATITASSTLQLATEYASGTVTLTNTTGAAITVYEGTVLTNSTGTYQVGNDPSVAGFFAYTPDKSNGSYSIAAGSSVTVPVYSTNAQSGTAANVLAQILAQTTTATNTLASTTLPAGITIAGSSAISATGPTSALASQIYGGWGPDTGVATGRGYSTFVSGQGFAASEANINLPLTTNFTTADLTSWKAYVDTMRGFGVLNVAPVVTSPSVVLDIARSDATASLRSAALYGGGIDIDTTPAGILAMGATAITSLVDDIKWAAANGLRSTMTLRAYGDTGFLENTKAVLAQLQAAGAMPSQIAVVGSPTSSTINSTELANAVAQYAATLALTPSAAESGLETTGGTTIDAIMTGVQSRLILVGTTPATPYAGVQVFTETASTILTAVVALTDTVSGTLSTTGSGTLSADASTLTVSGTAAQIDTALAALRYTPNTAANGTATLNLAITDTKGTIQGATNLVVDGSLALSGVAPVSVNGWTMLQPSLGLSVSPSASRVTATVTVSNAGLGSFWNVVGATVSADGGTVTMVGSAATVQSFLQQLVLMPTRTASGTETETITVSDGIGSTSAVATLSLSVATGFVVSGLGSSANVLPFVANAPFQDIAITKQTQSTQDISVIVTLPTGAANLVSSGIGSVSANGLTFTYDGTPAQLQAALRGLTVSTPASAMPSTETMMLNINGRVTTTVLSIGSADTVFVGAPDVTQGQYGATSIAAPLLVTGKVGLFDDYNAATATVVAGTATTLVQTWSGAAAGVYNSGETSGLALQTVTLANNTGSAITIPVGTLVATAAGVQFQIVQYNTGNANWVAGATGDGTIGSYVIAAGSSLALTAEAVVAGYTGNVAANAITSIAGATITASSTLQLATEYASGTVTLTNTTGAAITVYEGTVLTNSTGTYQVGNDPSVAGFFAYTPDKSNGSYSIAAGSSVTVPVYSTNAQSGTAANVLAQILAQTTTATNTLASTTLPAGITIAGSSAISATGPTSALASQIYGGWGPDTGVATGRGYSTFVSGQGFAASEANINLPLTTNFTTADLTSWKAYVDTMRGFGVLNVAPVVTSPSVVLDIARSDATASLRSAALYGGGIDIDTTPAGILAMGATAITSLVDDIKWAAANGLRSTMTLRAYGDTGFLENTKAVLAQLQAAGAMPSQIAVVGSPTSSTINSTELANAVAQYAATLALTPSAAESGLETTGGTTIDAIMTGVQSRLILVGTTPATPYAGVQVFTETASTILTAVVALTDTVSGTLSTTGSGTLSADASTLTVSGTAAQIDTALAALRYTPNTAANGTATLNLAITDTKGTIQGATNLVVGTPAAKLSIAAAGTGGGTVSLSVSTPISEGGKLTATSGGTVSSGAFQVSNAASADAQALAGLMVTKGAGMTGADLQITITGAAVTFVDSGTGHDTISACAYSTIQTGSTTTEVIADAGDIIQAGTGSVFAHGNQGFLFLGGSSAADTVTGSANGGSFHAGTGGGSLLTAGSGYTDMYAGGSNDTLVGGGATLMVASSGSGTVLRASAGDTIIGAAGSNISGPAAGTKIATITTQAGNETVTGGGGAMSVTGGSGSLTVNLGSGLATIVGGSGTETLVASSGGRTTLVDGAGAELLALTKGTSTGTALTWMGFVSGKDHISLTGYGTSTQQVLQSQVASTSGTVLSLSDGATITLLGLSHLVSTDVATH